MPLIELTTLLTTTVVPAITTIITTAAAKASAIYASGAVAWVEPDGFLRMLGRADGGLVFHAQRGRAAVRHEYLGGHGALLFYTKSDLPLRLPDGCQTVAVKSIWKRSV
ncbi:MAG: hypothetical protein ABGY41_03575 [Candidatus Poribacteria bacterium]